MSYSRPAYPVDFVKETSTTTTTGDLLLPNTPSTAEFQTFDNNYSDGSKVMYAASNRAGKWQVGFGQYNASAHSISRGNAGNGDYVWWSSAAGADVDFTGESVDIYPAQISMGGNLCIQYHNINSNVSPSTGDDGAHGYDVASFWHNAVTPGGEGSWWICEDSVPGAAVWNRFLTSNLKITQPATMTAGGTTGAQTIDKPAGSVNFAAGASSLVVTNSLVTTSSIILPVLQTNDATARIANVVPGSGSFTINLTANATAETKCAFVVIN